jgi:oligopeptide transport system permease protein
MAKVDEGVAASGGVGVEAAVARGPRTLWGPPRRWGGVVRAGLPPMSTGLIGAVLLVVIAVPCFVTLPWSLQRYGVETARLTVEVAYMPPSVEYPMGTDRFGRSLVWRCLLGGAISLGIGVAAAMIAVVIGVAWGAIAGYVGGRVDSAMMRVVDVLYGLPYILLVVLIGLALQPVMAAAFDGLPGLAADTASGLADVVTLLIAIGGVSWLTMARVIRGQVLSLREQPFIEAARAMGLGPARIIRVHLLPNLVGPIVVYTTLTVPAAILQESFLSFLGIGVQPPLPSWGNLATEGVEELPKLAYDAGQMHWWLLVFPCLLLGLTLMALNFLGDALRNHLDPRTRSR